MPDPRAADQVRAAGAVLWRPADSGTRVAVIHRPKYDDWSFAKGKVNPGEHVLLTAVREVFEETGLHVTLGRRLRPVEYVIVDDVPKLVDYWVARPEEKSTEFAANAEVDELRWLPVEQAASRLSYPRDVATLEEFQAGPPQTFPLILIRHASAGNKSAWRKGDLSRPLDPDGKKQAMALASLLRCFGVCRVVSAPAERCVATVRPYAEAVGVQIETEPSFVVVKGELKRQASGGARRNGKDAATGVHPEAAAKAIAQFAAADSPVIICAHRENLPALLDAACAELGAENPAGRPLGKGEFLVLHRAAGRLAAAEVYHPEQSLLSSEHESVLHAGRSMAVYPLATPP